MTEKEHKASIDDDICHLRWLDGHLYDQYLNDIDRDMLEAVTQVRKAEGVTNATVNRMLEIVRAILRASEREWGWLDAAPAVRMLPEPKRRVRWLKQTEAERLLTELPEHLAEMVRFTLASGLRERNVTHLAWEQVDLVKRLAWVYPDQMKTRKALPVPLDREAILVLRRQIGRHPVRVFTYRGRPVNKANTRAWRQALKRAEITDFRWHDLRHTWASWHMQSGTPPHVIRELGGWSSDEMVRRYAHLSADHLAEHVDRLCQFRTKSGTAVDEEKSAEGSFVCK